MHKSIFTISIMLLALLIAWGCGGDDECPNCPTNVDTVTVTATDTLTDTVTDTLVLPQEFLAWVDGFIQLDPEFYFQAYVFANAGQNPYIDSLTIADTTFLDMEPGYWYHESDPTFYISVFEDAVTPFYVSGDTAVVTLYGSEMSSTCRIVLLDYEDDEGVILVPADGDAVVPYTGEGYTCEWARIENAEWYGLDLYYTLDSSGTQINRRIYTYTYDTSYTVAEAVDGFPVDQVSLHALPTTGPDPESGVSNWTGDLATGKLYSITNYASADVVFVDTDAAAKLSTAITAERPTISPQEMIEAIYEAYR